MFSRDVQKTVYHSSCSAWQLSGFLYIANKEAAITLAEELKVIGHGEPNAPVSPKAGQANGQIRKRRSRARSRQEGGSEKPTRSVIR